METEKRTAVRYMDRTFSDGSSDADISGAFSDCPSDRSGEFPSSPSTAIVPSLQRLLVSCAAAEVELSDESLRSLVAELESPSATSDDLLSAAMQLRFLAKNKPENRSRIAAAGAVRPLVALISHPDYDVQENGVTAILNLSLCDENKPLIAAAGAIKPLISALKSGGSAAARENAACALLRLSQIDEHKITIGRSGAIPLLVNMLAGGGARAKKDAATALFSLCQTKENKIRSVEAGIVRPLLELMADSESGMVDKAAYVLAAVVETAEGRAAAVAEDGIAVLVEMIETGSHRQKEIAVAALLKICEDCAATYRAAVRREGAIPPLVALSQSGTSRAKRKAEELLRLLRQPRTTAARAVTEEIIGEKD